MSDEQRTRAILGRLREPGAYLGKMHRSFASGYVQILFTVMPGSLPVPAHIARVLIDSGRLVPRDADLFGDRDNSLSWVIRPEERKPAHAVKPTDDDSLPF